MLTSGYRQFALIIPFILVSPAYFAGRVQLGGLMQTASAFDNVREAFSVIIDIYREIAEWRAVVERLDGFDTAIAQAEHAAVATPSIAVVAEYGARALTLRDVTVQLPNGAPLVEARDVTIAPGDRVLVSGPSGSGKSTTFRAIAGIWPFGSGTVTVPEGARMMMLPQRPYLPIGSLEGAVSYPSHTGSFDRGSIAELLIAVGLPALAPRIDEDAHWHRILSPGEQERLAVARALLHAPDFLFLDEATASLDEASEAVLYRLLHERLPNATIVSIGHRSTLAAFHRRRLALEPEQGRHHMREAAALPAQ
jgi:putative ATP-binding cassette transporter